MYTGHTTSNQLQTVASTLLEYAARDEEFSVTLQDAIQQLFGHIPYNAAYDLTVAATCSPHLQVKNLDEAIVRARWLLFELEEASTIEQLALKQGLLAWSRQYESPKLVAIGTIGTVIPLGIVGIIEKKKKEKLHVQILVDRTEYQALSAGQRVQLSNELTLRLLSNQLRQVGGDSSRLDPDMFDWFYHDRLVSIGLLDTEALQAAHLEISEANLPHLTHQNEDCITAIVLHPMVDPALLDDLGASKLR